MKSIVKNEVKAAALSLCLAGCLILFFSAVSSCEENAGTEELFMKAMQMETQDADYEGAMWVYNDILRENPENEEITAKALGKIEVCYKKLGYTEKEWEVMKNRLIEEPVRVNAFLANARSRPKSPFKSEETIEDTMRQIKERSQKRLALLNKKLPPFPSVLKCIDGTEIREELIMGKVSILFFWSKIFASCKIVMKDLIALSDEYSSEDICILAINVTEDKEEHEAFIELVNPPFPCTCIALKQARRKERKLWNQTHGQGKLWPKGHSRPKFRPSPQTHQKALWSPTYGLGITPYILFIDKEGVVRNYKGRYEDKKELRNIINQVLGYEKRNLVEDGSEIKPAGEKVKKSVCKCKRNCNDRGVCEIKTKVVDSITHPPFQIVIPADDKEITKAQLEEVLRRAKTALKEVEKLWNVSWDRSKKIEILVDTKSNAGVGGLPTGTARPAISAIFIPIWGGAGIDTLKHEITHLFTPNFPRWLMEGTAVYAGHAGENPGWLKQGRVAQILENFSVDKLSKMCGSRKIHGYNKKIYGYKIAQIIVYHLVETYGLEKMQRLIQQEAQFPEVFEEIYGFSIADFEKEAPEILSTKIINVDNLLNAMNAK